MAEFNLFIPCPRGLESALATELATLSCQAIETTDGGVACQGDWAEVYAINLHSRVASRVLIEVGYGRYRSENDIYNVAKKVDWPSCFSVDDTIKVKVEAKRSPLRRLDVAALKIKDAVCDVFRDAYGKRPSVDKHKPDVRVQAFLSYETVTLYVDTSGEALFKRGYRAGTGDAPLRENLAAGMLMLAGYDGSQTFLDPMSGSGTIAIEAAMIASSMAPGLLRDFAFERLNGFSEAAWLAQLQAAKAMIKQPKSKIYAGDINRFVLKEAINNAQNAYVNDYIDFKTKDILEWNSLGDTGLIVSNPPYGVRLEDEAFLQSLYPQMGSWLKQNFTGWTAAFLSADMGLGKGMRLSPRNKYPLFNGNLDCRLFVLELVAGSNRRK